jgi:branched-chain amino acid transport system permease protein
MKSFWYLGMLVIGGLGSTLGAVLGVIFVQLLDELVIAISPTIGAALPAIGAQVFAALGQIVFALAIILFLVFEPRGLSHRWQIFKASYRLWPFSY